MIAWVLHILELIAGIFGVGIGISRLPDAASALAVVTPTAVGLVGLLATVTTRRALASPVSTP